MMTTKPHSLSLATLVLTWMSTIGLAAATASAQTSRPNTSELPAAIEKVLVEIRNDSDDLPAIAVLVQRDGAVLANVAHGVRRADQEDPVTPTDVWHLGSCTKSMTATLLAILIEREVLAWTDTIAEVCKRHGSEMRIHKDLQDVTLRMLVRHRSGLAANVPFDEFEAAETQHPKDVRAQRAHVVATMLSRAPENAPAGSVEVYSNAGYIVVGALLELATDTPWEVLMQTELFGPLGMKTAGFGPPGDQTKLIAPSGHYRDENGTLIPVFADNPAALGPAGTVHASLADWAKYAQLHVRAFAGKPTGLETLSTKSCTALYDTKPNVDYGAGWVVNGGRDGTERTLWHNGSNTMWYCESFLRADDDTVILVATNAMADRSSGIALRRVAGLVDDLAATSGTSDDGR